MYRIFDHLKPVITGIAAAALGFLGLTLVFTLTINLDLLDAASIPPVGGTAAQAGDERAGVPDHLASLYFNGAMLVWAICLVPTLFYSLIARPPLRLAALWAALYVPLIYTGGMLAFLHLGLLPA